MSWRNSLNIEQNDLNSIRNVLRILQVSIATLKWSLHFRRVSYNITTPQTPKRKHYIENHNRPPDSVACSRLPPALDRPRPACCSYAVDEPDGSTRSTRTGGEGRGTHTVQRQRQGSAATTGPISLKKDGLYIYRSPTQIVIAGSHGVHWLSRAWEWRNALCGMPRPCYCTHASVLPATETATLHHTYHTILLHQV